MDIDQILPVPSIEIADDDHGCYLTVDGARLPFINGEVSQAALSAFKRVQDLVKNLGTLEKKLSERLLQAHEKGVPVRSGFRSLQIEERATTSASYKDAYEDLATQLGWLKTQREEYMEKNYVKRGKSKRPVVQVAK